MSKRAVDRPTSDAPPARQPHAAIVELLREHAARAYSCEEIVAAVRSQAPQWNLGGTDLPVTQRVAVRAALGDLLGAGIIDERADGADRHYQIQRRSPPSR